MKHTASSKQETETPEVVERVKLIDGDFDHTDAVEILMQLIGHKIHYHKLKNFSSEERLGVPHEKSVQRLVELNRDRERLLEVLDYAEKNNLKISIQSTIEIQLLA